ncbi:MAG TPA: PAS domain S-box protein [Gemmatimonadales bacterium]|nr:PAS domain S-box protein [Gemmatimonadales bacterium]
MTSAAYGLLSAVIESTPDPVFVKDRQGRYLLVNGAEAHLLGHSVEHVLGRTDKELLPAELASSVMDADRSVLETGTTLTSEREFQVGDDLRTYLTSRSVYRDGEGRPAGVFGIGRDITERKRAEERFETTMRESEAQYRLLFEANPNPMWVYDLETLRFLAVNDAATRSYGYSRDEFLGMTIKDIRPIEEVPRLVASLESSGAPGAARSTWRHRTRDGSRLDVEIVGSPLRFRDRPAELILAHDVTARMRLEEQFRHAQKMEAVGRLAGGVAHDFNNLLTAILGHSELLLGDMSPADPRRDDLTEIVLAAERAAALTRQLLAFSRQQVLEPQLLDLNAIVTQLSKMLHRLLGEDIDLSLALTPGLGRIKADPGQIEQVLVNLAVNSRDAMPDGGKLTIETWEQEVDQDQAHADQPIPPGRYVMMGITDDGAGMDEGTRRRLFEPFFTTKEAGKGTGLGLSTVYGIVTQSGGYIWVYSEPGRGTTFKIYLPLADDATAPVATVAAAPEAAVTSGWETILLVEDDAAVRKLAAEVLERQGYHVIVTGSAAEARAALQQLDGPLHLLITDIVMPDLRGPDLAEIVRAARPECKVLYMSGYAPEAVVRHGSIQSGRTFIGKPFSPAVFVRKVRAVLDDDEPGGVRA